MKKPLVEGAPCIVKINVTPIIDVALVLVIILLVTAPILSVADLDIQLPTAHTRGAEDDVRISVTLGSQGELAIDVGRPVEGARIPDQPEHGPQLRQVFQQLEVVTERSGNHAHRVPVELLRQGAQVGIASGVDRAEAADFGADARRAAREHAL